MNVTPFPTFPKEKSGLKYWMKQVADSIAALHGEFPAKPVHDLRVALRRCISIADGMGDVAVKDPWKTMGKRARKLFRSLGAMRDSQVLAEWILRIDPAKGASSVALLAAMKAADDSGPDDALRAIVKFDRKRWRDWSISLSPDFRRVVGARPVCECLAVEALESLYHRHRLAQKSPSPYAFHRLRAAVKTFRYRIENFLPNLYPGWARDLQFLQDVLGEMHDVDVLSQRIATSGELLDEAARKWWGEKLEQERASRILKYRQKMSESDSPLAKWREVLPGEKEYRAIGLAKLSAWASFLSPDFARSRRIAKFALQIHDGFSNCGLISREIPPEERSILHAAALLQDVGRSSESKAFHKESYRMIRGITPPVGWSKRDLALVATIARFHRRALPRPNHKILRDYSAPARHTLLFQVACLRLANAFMGRDYRSVRRLEVERFDKMVIVRAEGYTEGDRFTPKLSVAVHLMESVCLYPVQILPRGARVSEPKSIPRPAAVLAVRS